MRKVYVYANVKFVLQVDEGEEISDIMDEVYLASDSSTVDITSLQILNYEITDSK